MKRFLILPMLLLFFGCDEAPKIEPPKELLNPSNPQEAVFLQDMTSASLNVPVTTSVLLGNGVTMELVLIPAGEFYMGSPSKEALRESSEGPVHQVKISKPFYMGKYEVTQLQYNALMGYKKFKFRGDAMPAENVNWYEVNSFIGVLCKDYGYKFHLPSEAQWEYACRAGTTTPFYTGETISSEQANYNSAYIYGKGRNGINPKMTSPVGKYPPNPFGLYDMHGNVWEWCSDFYMPDYYKKGKFTDPQGPATAGGHVIRGGSWRDKPERLRSASRSGKGEGADKKYLGFRVAMEIPEGTGKQIGSVILPLNKKVSESGIVESTIIQAQQPQEIESELVYDENTRQGYISVKGKGLEARNWMLKKIEEVCASKNIVLEEGRKPQPAYYRLLDETLADGVYTIKFEVIH
ncbi:MAG: formylglycine-generating enzyme family protein [Phycisphaerae bacterium]